MEDTLEVVERLVDEDVGHFCDWGTNRNAWGEFDWNFCALEKDSPRIYTHSRGTRVWRTRSFYLLSAQQDATILKRPRFPDPHGRFWNDRVA